MVRPGRPFAFAALLATLSAFPPLLGDDPPPSHTHDATEPGVITIGGRVHCLDFDLQPNPDAEACNEAGAARFGLRTDGDLWFYFLEDDPRAEMFVDSEVRSRELSVRGWPRDDEQFEILSVHSVKHGRLFDLHYRCDVCNITATAPGPCWCCRAPFELRETPSDTSSRP